MDIRPRRPKDTDHPQPRRLHLRSLTSVNSQQDPSRSPGEVPREGVVLRDSPTTERNQHFKTLKPRRHLPVLRSPFLKTASFHSRRLKSVFLGNLEGSPSSLKPFAMSSRPDVCPLSMLNPFAGVFFSQNATFGAATAVKQSLRWETSLPAYQTKPPDSQPRPSQSSSFSSIRSPKLQSTFRSSREPRPSYGSTAPANGMRPTLHPRAA